MKTAFFSALFLSITIYPVYADPSSQNSKLIELNNKIEDSQAKTQELVEEYNRELEHQHALTNTPPSGNIGIGDTTVISPSPEHISSFSDDNIIQRLKDLIGRLEIVEKDLSELKKTTPVPLGDARTSAEALATKKANDNAPHLNTTSIALAQYEQALALFNKGIPEDLNKAIQALDVVIKDFPQDTYAHKSMIHKAEAYLKLKQYAQAENSFIEALKVNTENSVVNDIRLGLCDAQFQQNKQVQVKDLIKILDKEILSEAQKNRLNDIKINLTPSQKSVVS